MELSIQERLKDLRVERGLTLEQLAEQTHLSKSALGSYEAEDFKDISHYALIKLAKFYGVTSDYLLGLSETKNHPNADLADLRLSDDMIELLKSGKLNNRLLSELALHKDFQRFLVDIEIFVDRVADMRINDMNAILEANRKQIMEKHNPGENDLYVRTLELAQVSEENFFAHVVHKDIDGILHDIREAHRKDTTTADTASPVVEIQKQMETALHYEGTEEEKKARLFLATLGIDYDKLTPEEFEVIKTHSLLGAEMLQNLDNFGEQPLLQTAYEIARWHHERWDGRGYPDGLKGDDIPISAQLVSMADVYDALTSERCYKKAFPHETAVQMITNGECGAFNPLLLQCLLDVQGELKQEILQW